MVDCQIDILINSKIAFFNDNLFLTTPRHAAPFPQFDLIKIKSKLRSCRAPFPYRRKLKDLWDLPPNIILIYPVSTTWLQNSGSFRLNSSFLLRNNSNNRCTLNVITLVVICYNTCDTL